MIGVVPTSLVMAVGEVRQKPCDLSEVSGEVLRKKCNRNERNLHLSSPLRSIHKVHEIASPRCHGGQFDKFSLQQMHTVSMFL